MATGVDSVEYIHLVRGHTLVKTKMNFEDPKKTGNFLTN